GGVHVPNTANIGLFKILSEASTGAGVRRIEAVTGHGALAYTKEAEDIVKAACSMLKARSGEVIDRLGLLQEELKAAEHKVSQLENKMASAQVSDIDSQIRTIKGIRVLVQIVNVNDLEALRALGDKMRDKVDGVVVLAAKFAEDKISILAMATKKAVESGINSGNIVREVAKIMGGGGGGRPDMAQAGGKDASKMNEAMEKAWNIVENLIK
ncbi:MAG: DHHA1 domain-containing protein, partial [Acidaminococcaceae bacterium]|nr:DHHA1 domain-containing protein [Acidaminococcaceae bacterium]